MKHFTGKIAAAGLVLAVIVSNCAAVVRDGRRLDGLRESVLRLHILAESDSDRDQQLKLEVRDTLLEKAGDIFLGAQSLEEAEEAVSGRLTELEDMAEEVLRSRGCDSRVTAQLEDVYFGERTYGEITMPAGEYRALRLKIGSAQGHNWWCVMYPALCVPAAVGRDGITGDSSAAEDFFTSGELDILYHPKKYRVRFAVWDKIKAIREKLTVQNDEKCEGS